MKKTKFQTLCEKVLVPRTGEIVHQELTSVHETLDIMSSELVRIEVLLQEIVARQQL